MRVVVMIFELEIEHTLCLIRPRMSPGSSDGFVVAGTSLCIAHRWKDQSADARVWYI